jgi:hypothetical protein
MSLPSIHSLIVIARRFLCIVLACLPFLADCQETTIEMTPDTVIVHTKPQRAHYKLYLTDLIGLAVNTGRATVGREFMVGKDLTAEAELGVRVMPPALMLDNELFTSFPGVEGAKAGPLAGVHFRWYPEIPVFGDKKRNFVGINAGLSTEMSLVYMRQLDIYDNNDFRPILMYNVMDADVFSLRVTPFLGFNDFWRAYAVRGFTFHGSMGYMMRWDKIQGDVRKLSLSTEPRPRSFSLFRSYPTVRFGLGYAF